MSASRRPAADAATGRVVYGGRLKLNPAAEAHHPGSTLAPLAKDNARLFAVASDSYDTESSSPPGTPPAGAGEGGEMVADSKKAPACSSWRHQWRIGALMGASVVSLYCCVFWLIYALSMEGGRRPGLFLSATCLLLLVALGVTLLSIRKLCDLLAPAPVPV